MPILTAKPSLKLTSLSIAAILAATTFATGCNPVQDSSNLFKQTFNSDDPCSNNARNIGILAGSVLGAVIANKVGDGNAAIITGTLLGAGLGALIGNDIDDRRCELSKISKKYQVPIQTEEIAATDAGMTVESASKDKKSESIGLKVSLQDTGKQFASGSDQLTPEAKAYFAEIAKTYSPTSIATKDPKTRQQQEQLLKQKKILLMGHTDDVGSTNFNAELAEKRAKVVAELFAANGVPRDNLHYQGAGETQPIADNRTEEGRAKNRRAEIVELPNQEALESYLALRKPVIAYYRTESGKGFGGHKSMPTKPTAAITKPSVSRDEAKSKADTVAKILVPAAKQPQVASKWRFEGNALTQTNAAVSVGEVVPEKDKWAWMPFISTANASSMDSVYANTCAADRPRAARGVKSLASGKEIEYKTSNFLPGMNNTAWMGDVGQHRVGLAGVAVARDGSVPTKNPTLIVYANNRPSTSDQPAAKLTAQANAYQGKEGVLYRVFVTEDTTPVSCIDMVVSNKSPFSTSSGYLIHQESGQAFATEFKPNKI